MSKDGETISIKMESYYVKKSDGRVYYYWRTVGSNSWNIQKTAMKDVPTVEMVAEARNKVIGYHEQI